MALRAMWQFMDWSVTPKILYGPVHKLPFGPKCHELFVILYTSDQNYFNQKTIGCIIWTFLIQILK